MRRTHLRGYTNILQRLLVYTGWGSNLGLVMRHRIGFRTPGTQAVHAQLASTR